MAFAEGTTVSSEKSRLEIEALVCRYAGRDAEFSSGRIAGQAAVMFVAKGRRVRFTIPMPTNEEAAKAAKRKGSWRDATGAQKATWIEQETRRRWRPGEMTEEQQRVFLAEGEEFSPGRAAWAGKILDAYDLGGAL